MRHPSYFYSILLIALPLWAALSGGLPSAQAPFLAHHDRYQCPMHPQIVTDHPGDCPICHMHLQKIDDEGPQAQAAGGVPGKAGFTLSQERQQLIGVRHSAAEILPLALTVRMPGRVSSSGQVLAQLLEIDAGSLKPGMKGHLRGPLGASMDATVTGVESGMDSASHNFGVTLRPASRAGWMRKGVFCEVSVDVDLGRHLAVPEDAILDTGERQVLFVVDEQGRFEPRQVTVGLIGDEAVEVKEGLKAGEQVVTSANFLIDSESRFRAALEQFQGSRP